jgi:hypothetical protein
MTSNILFVEMSAIRHMDDAAGESYRGLSAAVFVRGWFGAGPNVPRAARGPGNISTSFADDDVVLNVFGFAVCFLRHRILQHPFDFGFHRVRKIVALHRAVGA